MMIKTKIPILLTFARMLCIPFIIYIYYSSFEHKNLFVSLIFMSSSATDYFDGYFARKFNAISKLGTFLDPVADKLLIASVAFLLADYFSNPWVNVCLIIIVLREIFVSSIREWLALNKKNHLTVSWLGKVKTVSQLASFSMLLYSDTVIYGLIDLQGLGISLLYIAAGLTVVSMLDYMRVFFRSY